MSFVSIVPETLSTAADNLQSVGLRLQAQNSAAVAPTTGLIPPASDEISAWRTLPSRCAAEVTPDLSAE